MIIDNYLKERLENCSKYTLTEEDKKIIKYEGIEVYIFRKLKSKKYRKTSLDEASEAQIKNAISLRVKKNQPIRFIYPFGAYKLWRIPSFPFVDFAEFFTIAYLSEYVSSIVAAYEKGVEFVFSSDDVCIELIDNYKREELDSYNSSFNDLLKVFSQYFPSNYTMQLKQVYPDVYSNKEEYQKELEALYEARKQEGINDAQRASLVQKMELHFRSKGAIDYGELNEQEKMKVWEDLSYWSDAYLKLPKRRQFNRAEDNIVLFSNKISNAIDVGSTKASKSKFWTGIGVLENIDGHITEKILSPKQWEVSKVDAKFHNLEFKTNSNLKTIPVFEKRLNFLEN